MHARIALLALVVVALVLPAAASAEKLTIQLISVQTVQQIKNIPPRNKINKGDIIEFKDLMRNEVKQFGKAKNTPVAFDAGVITYTSATQRILKCTVSFPGIGTLSYGGVMIDRADHTSVFSITGGTGGFTHAKGTVTFRDTQAKDALNVFNVVVPGNPIDMTSSTVG